MSDEYKDENVLPWIAYKYGKEEALKTITYRKLCRKIVFFQWDLEKKFLCITHDLQINLKSNIFTFGWVEMIYKFW